MSFSNWLHEPAIRRSLGVAAALLLAAVVGVALWVFQPPKPVPQDLEPFAHFFAHIDPQCAALLANPESASGTPYQIDDCEDKAVAQRKGYRDLAQAIRSANAAEDATWLSLLQTRASIVGAAFLVLTLFATAWAAWAAADAARVAETAAVAAQRSADISQREFSLTHRPKLRVRKVIIPRLTEGGPVTIQAEIANIGGTTAILRTADFSVTAGAATLGAAQEWSQERRTGTGSTRRTADGKPIETMHFIPAGASFVVALTTTYMHENSRGYPAGKMTVRGEVTYVDTFLGHPADIQGKLDFKLTSRKTAFERVFRREDRSGVIWFAKSDPPDPEFEYED